MKQKIIICFIVLSILTIIGIFIYFNKEELQEGSIYNKTHKLPWVQFATIPLIVSNGKTNTIITTQYVYYHPEQWIISIKDYDEKNKEFKTNCFFVYEEVYNQVQIGDRFKFDKSKGFDEEPIIKTKQ
jgi:hypothetical protein